MSRQRLARVLLALLALTANSDSGTVSAEPMRERTDTDMASQA